MDATDATALAAPLGPEHPAYALTLASARAGIIDGVNLLADDRFNAK